MIELHCLYWWKCRRLSSMEMKSLVTSFPPPLEAKMESPSRPTATYMAERVVGTGSFRIVFQAKCLETGENVYPKACIGF
ncbi:hypothetical protein Dsin_029719 [Dipteronia sinensis]|uniref:Uncharacterized protein n=1 Tax=Dipteronia sinensis TaxID=43782 RepID=A0AAD9ZT44_9ROSI|nr:hypothetical protein Dsin_029719 [Dipteronia sinensis]